MARELSPLTGLEVACNREAGTSTTYYEDPVCGPYAIYDDSGFSSLLLEEKRKLAKILATRRLRYGKSPIRITKTATGMHGAWEQVPIANLLAQYPSDNGSIFDEALVNLSKMIGFASDIIKITRETCWSIFAHDDLSVQYVIRQLEDMGFVKLLGHDDVSSYPIPILNIESKGWERLRELRDNSSQSDQVFVAMWFHNLMQAVYDNAIAPAILDAGFRPLRIDLKEHNNKICDEIIAEIRRSRFVVADFTGNRGGVYYEAGFAHGLGKPVIWTVLERKLKRIHFDTRQYNHITYTTPEELRERLFNRIRATQ